ncbi:MAG: hypothetical protein IJ350_07670 [Clostridia bacterium]|nr:hypothetical protein [Clostridia bacterium]
MAKQPESSITTVGLDLAADIATLPLEQIREGLCERCGEDAEVCRSQCARPCAFGLRFIDLTKEQGATRKLPDWQVQMQQEAIQRAQTCQKYINGGHDEATAALLAGYKSTASWSTAKKKYAGQLTDLPAMKKEEPQMLHPRSVRITQVTGKAGTYALDCDGTIRVEAFLFTTNAKNIWGKPEDLRRFVRELTDALDVLEAPEVDDHAD